MQASARVALAAADTEWHSLDAAEMRAGRELDSAGSISGQSRLREGAGERRAAPTGSTSRRERRDEAAGTLSRVLGARTGAGRRLASKRERVALLPEEREGGRAGQGWGMGSSGRVSRPPPWQRLYLRAGVGRRCEAEGGAAARAASEGASHGRGGEGAAGSVSNRRRGGLGVQLAAA